MVYSTDKIASLIGSRICHDLISPVGAISNGLELLELSGMPKSPELSLVAESAGSASARIRFFRLVFGDPVEGQLVGGQSVADLLSEVYQPGRITVNWHASGEYPRPMVRAALLALLCAEEPLRTGGQIDISEAQGAWTIKATAKLVSPTPELWGILRGIPPQYQVTPAAVQFVLLPEALQTIGLKIATQTSDKHAEIRF